MASGSGEVMQHASSAVQYQRIRTTLEEESSCLLVVEIAGSVQGRVLVDVLGLIKIIQPGDNGRRVHVQPHLRLR